MLLVIHIDYTIAMINAGNMVMVMSTFLLRCAYCSWFVVAIGSLAIPQYSHTIPYLMEGVDSIADDVFQCSVTHTSRSCPVTFLNAL